MADRRRRLGMLVLGAGVPVYLVGLALDHQRVMGVGLVAGLAGLILIFGKGSSDDGGATGGFGAGDGGGDGD